ncbi:cytochrome P450 [Xylariaceae sp. FL0662B]|nr:cytochrome P450 [Xylariaceae sp. FL0662B]
MIELGFWFSVNYARDEKTRRCVLGILCHRLYFIHGEHYLKAGVYLRLWLLITTSVTIVLSLANDHETSNGSDRSNFNVTNAVVLMNCAFLDQLFDSIFVYRVFEHPLRHFKGPFLAAVSKLWHWYYIKCPQELMIITPDALQSAWYDMLMPFEALNSIRVKDGYTQHRKAWDDALKLSSTCKSLLIRQIRSAAKSPINITAWLYHFSFDAMGDLLSFRRSFSPIPDLTSGSDSHDAPSIMTQGMSMLRFFTPVSWLGHLYKWNRALSWAAEVCDVRLLQSEREMGTDVFSHFVHRARNSGHDHLTEGLALYGDAFAIIVAGSHTTAHTLTILLYELSQRLTLQDDLRKEVASTMIVKEDNEDMQPRLSAGALERLPILNGCINECLRVYPVLPKGEIRQTVENGVMINGRWIPPQTLTRLLRIVESAFEKPHEFVPERWTMKPNMQLGLMEVRIVAAMIVSNFEFTLSQGEDKGGRFIDELQDAFTAMPGKLYLRFSPLNLG